MKISRYSKLIRYIYLGEDWIPESTTLCRLFWHGVLKTCVLLIPFVAVGGYIVAWAKHPWDTLFATLIVLAGIVTLTLASYVSRRVENYRYNHRWDEAKVKEPGIIATAFWAVKNRVCPRIEITRD